MNLFRSILEIDRNLSTQMRVAEKPGLMRSISIFFAHSGDSWFWGLGLVITWLVGSTAWKDWASVQFMSIALLAVLVLAIKFSIRRRRPEGEWGGIYRSTDPHSFPSGHAARSFLIAVISLGLGPAWLAILLCIWAPLVSLARVAMGVHYLSDVAAGAVLGMMMGFVCYQLSGYLLAGFHSLLGMIL